MDLSDKHLEELLRRCTEWPWVVSMRDNEEWEIRSEKGRLVCRKVPEDVINIDRRLMGLAPILAFEVLMLRKKLAKTNEANPKG